MTGNRHEERRVARRQRQRARYIETLGLILIALLILAVTLARFAKTIPWRLR